MTKRITGLLFLAAVFIGICLDFFTGPWWPAIYSWLGFICIICFLATGMARIVKEAAHDARAEAEQAERDRETLRKFEESRQGGRSIH